MKKISILLVSLLFVGINYLQAQSSEVSGTITSSEDGMPIPGVSVVVTGTTTGVTTNIDGKYTLDVPADATTLTFSFVGMKTKIVEIAGQSILDVVLEPDIVGLDEVVVTALGISRDKKALGYSVSEFTSDDLENVQVLDATTALQGKIAGVSISPSSGAPGASTRVIVRGISSLTGSNQPLYVVDGVPVNNSFISANSTQPSTTANRTVDFGNAAADINPDDIASISFLKGASSTNIYGSRAANGAIIITTKSGSVKDKFRVGLSSGYSVTDVGRLPYYQDVFGQGWSGHFDPIENGSWGPMLDGKDRLWGNTVDNSRKLAPFAFQENSLRDFYEYGYNLNNNINVSGGTENIGYYASYTNTKADGVIPTDVDLMNRHSILFKANGGTSKTKIDFSTNFINKTLSAVATGQGDDAGGGKTLFQEILQNPVNLYVPDFRDYENKFYNLDNYYTPYAQNPYYVVNENGNELKSNRIISSLTLSHEFIDGLKLTGRGGIDSYSYFYKDYGAVAPITPDSPNSTANDVLGLTKEEAKYETAYDMDLMLSYNRDLNLSVGNISFSALLGNNVNQRSSKRVTTISKGLVVPEYYNIQNISGAADISTYESLRRLVGVYGQVNIDFNEFLFLQLQARNDWSSTLPKENNSYFYPGANFGFLFSELLPSQNILNYGKLRVSYAFAGNDAPPYSIASYYTPASIRAGGFGQSNYPIGGVAAYENGSTLGNPNLKPEISKEFEIGTDIRILNSRVGVDVAYYNKVTTDLIMLANIAASSGYYYQNTNLGQITNEGVELALNLVPVQTSGFTWDMTYTFTKNNSILDELDESLGVTEYVINSAYEAEFVAVPGEQLAQFRIPDYKYSPEGKIIVGDNGLPLEGDKRYVGSSVPDYNMSLNNAFSYKGLRLSFMGEMQKGGYMYSYTSSITYWSGNNEQSLTNMRRPWVIPNSVVEVLDDDGNVTGYEENSIPVNDNWHEYYSSNTNKPIEEERIIEKTYIRLREVTLSYRLPSSLLSNVKLSGATISLYGRNLILWTPADNSFIDPESSTWGNDLEGMFGEFGGSPSVRTYGAKLNLSF